MELPEKPCASIDARLRDWDVLLGFRYSPTWQRQQIARSVIFGGPVGSRYGTFDGKLAGALAFRIGEFSKEPIAGVTPIAEMLEISALDRRPESPETDAKANVDAPTRTSTPGFSSVPSANYANYLKPIEAPLV